MGTQVVVPYRDEDEARLLKPMGDLGQIVRMVRFISHSGGPNNQLLFSEMFRNGTFVMRKR